MDSKEHRKLAEALLLNQEGAPSDDTYGVWDSEGIEVWALTRQIAECVYAFELEGEQVP